MPNFSAFGCMKFGRVEGVIGKNLEVVAVVAVQPILRGKPEETVACLFDAVNHALREAVSNGERLGTGLLRSEPQAEKQGQAKGSSAHFE